jgi:hypothetical protein
MVGSDNGRKLPTSPDYASAMGESAILITSSFWSRPEQQPQDCDQSERREGKHAGVYSKGSKGVERLESDGVESKL